MKKSFSIQNNEIKISFDYIPSQEERNKMKALQFRWNPTEQVWHASYSAEREKLAVELTGLADAVTIKADSVLVNTTLDELIEEYLTSQRDNNANQLTDKLIQDAADRIDEYIAGIRKYKEDAKEALEQKKSQEAIIKDAVANWAARKKMADDKRKFLEMIITEYCQNHNIDCISGQKYNASLKESYTYGISKELEEAIRQRASLPEWISLELKLDQKAIKQMDLIPEGIELISHYSVQTRSDDDNVPSYQESLNAFKQGKAIYQIAEERKLTWKTIYRHLKMAMKNGRLNIYDYISVEDMDKLRMAYSQNADLDAQAYSISTGRKVSFDIVMLGKAVLQWETTQNEDLPAE